MGCYFYASHCVFILSVTFIFIMEQEKSKKFWKIMLFATMSSCVAMSDLLRFVIQQTTLKVWVIQWVSRYIPWFFHKFYSWNDKSFPIWWTIFMFASNWSYCLSYIKYLDFDYICNTLKRVLIDNPSRNLPTVDYFIILVMQFPLDNNLNLK